MRRYDRPQRFAWSMFELTLITLSADAQDFYGIDQYFHLQGA